MVTIHPPPPTPLHRPIAVFDAGIGSYAAVREIGRIFPEQDIVYFADRANFPYGNKSRNDLLAIMERTLAFLDRFDPAAILMASNAPSITVLDALTDITTTPVFGVRPPIVAALEQAGDGDVVVLGVKSMTDSPELRDYARLHARDLMERVHLVNASALVDLVETGAFLFDEAGTQSKVDRFFATLEATIPAIACATLSSTHLPWLRDYIANARPGIKLFDPLREVISGLDLISSAGSGKVLGLVTEDENLSIEDFSKMLQMLGISIPLHVVQL